MSDDDTFFNQFHEAPRPEFAAALHERINQPMNAQTKPTTTRRMALSFALAAMLLVAAVFAYPPTRARAMQFLRQIGAFTITTEAPDSIQPTAAPPDPANQPISAATAREAGNLAGFAVLDPARLPDGYRQAGDLSIVTDESGTTVVSAFTGESGAFILVNQYRPAPGPAFTDHVAGVESAADVRVHGRDGVWVAGRAMVNPVTQQGGLVEAGWLMWEENGVTVTIMSDDLPLEAALEIAESLQ